MEIKIVTWNMAYWSHKDIFEEAWNYFLNNFDADFYFFQEARPPLEVSDVKENLVWDEIGGKRPWGSGIYSKRYRIVEEKIKTDYNGVFSIANTTVNNLPLTLVSIYGLMTDTYSITNLHRMLSDLTPILNGHINVRRNIVLGGDLNASIQFDPINNNKSHKIFFDRIEDFKLNDCFKLSKKEFPVQTLRHNSSEDKWQDDYLFVSDTLSKKLVTCEVVDNTEIRKYSDHNPVIITLDV
jgi:exonuclease III